jgi:molybdate/tungstate transport system permease protein
MALLCTIYVSKRTEAFASVSADMEKTKMLAPQVTKFSGMDFAVASRVSDGVPADVARAVSEFGAVAIIAYFPKTAPVFLFRCVCDSGLSAALQ